MKKLIANFYLFIILALVGQAIYVVFSSNTTITDSLKVKQIQAENLLLEDRIRILEDKITTAQAINHLTLTNEGQNFVAIEKRQIINAAALASLE